MKTDAPKHRRPVETDAAEKEARWKEENRAALESSNEYVRRHGLPLAKYRDEVWRDRTYWRT